MPSNWPAGTITNQLIWAANNGKPHPLFPCPSSRPLRYSVQVATICMYWAYLNDLYARKSAAPSTTPVQRESVQ